MAELNIGVIGTGNIGTSHARRLASEIAGARVRGVFDLDPERSAALAAAIGAISYSEVHDVIDDPAVDAVLITSPGPTHAGLSIACVAAGKPALCEKPLAPTPGECLEVMDAEVAYGARLIQVGFMRRYDPGYRALKETIDSGALGEILVAHCVHRNAASAPEATSSMLITDSAIHEIDAARWLLGDEIVAATVVTGRSSPRAPHGLRDPQLILLETAAGALVEVEVFVNCQYGYEVRCEVVGALGVASLETPSHASLTLNGARRQVLPADWRPRFSDAYREELQRWIEAVRTGTMSGPSSFDGYMASAVGDACVASLGSGLRTVVELIERPQLYATR